MAEQTKLHYNASATKMEALSEAAVRQSVGLNACPMPRLRNGVFKSLSKPAKQVWY